MFFLHQKILDNKTWITLKTPESYYNILFILNQHFPCFYNSSSFHRITLNSQLKLFPVLLLFNQKAFSSCLSRIFTPRKTRNLYSSHVQTYNIIPRHATIPCSKTVRSTQWLMWIKWPTFQPVWNPWSLPLENNGLPSLWKFGATYTSFLASWEHSLLHPVFLELIPFGGVLLLLCILPHSWQTCH